MLIRPGGNDLGLTQERIKKTGALAEKMRNRFLREDGYSPAEKIEAAAMTLTLLAVQLTDTPVRAVVLALKIAFSVTQKRPH